jgi:arylsulfatase A
MIDGKSQAAYLRGQAESPRQWIFNHYADDRVVRDQRFKLDQKGQLFDLQTDPEEQRPLSADVAPDAVAARQRLQKVLDDMPASTPLPFPYRSLSAFKKRAEEAGGGSQR